jgi:hypothetical protein
LIFCRSATVEVSRSTAYSWAGAITGVVILATLIVSVIYRDALILHFITPIYTVSIPYLKHKLSELTSNTVTPATPGQVIEPAKPANKEDDVVVDSADGYEP